MRDVSRGEGKDIKRGEVAAIVVSMELILASVLGRPVLDGRVRAL
jgi:hypothetical protein